MEAFKTVKGVVLPIDRSNVDTDAIIPKQYLKSVARSGFGANLFDEWRYLDHGEPGQEHSNRPINTDFVLNEKRYTVLRFCWLAVISAVGHLVNMRCGRFMITASR